MHLVSRALWSLVASMACFAPVVNAAGVLEIDVVFPRNNQTYAPTKYFPIVFAIQNAILAKHFELSGTCVVLADSSPTLTANPCRVKIDTAVTASMSASLHAALCRGLNPPADCPKENAVQQLVVAGVASFAAAFGTIGFLFAFL